MDKLISLETAMRIIADFGYTNCRDSRDYEANNRMDRVRIKISELPAAFNKEKVVEELSNLAEDSRKYWNEFDDEDAFGEMNAYTRAVEIVEKGGVEE